jgi:branched-chain amino acid transport system substrate-binding protein
MNVEAIRRSRRGRAAVAAAALVAACAFAFAQSGPARAAHTAAAALKYPVTNYVAYTKGKARAANSKLAPVSIGWVNNQGGQVLVGPTATQGAALAARWINDFAGGVGGHPVRLVNCFVANAEAEGTTCGQRLVNTKGLYAINFGGLAVGASSVESVVSPKIPIFCAICVNPGDATNKNTYIFGGTGTTVSWQWGTFAKNVLHAKSAAVVFPNGPGFIVPAQAQVQAFQAEGIKATSVGVDPSATDLSGALQAANVSKTDVITTSGTDAFCIAAAKALAQLNVPGNHVVSSPLCLAATVAKALGDYPKWIYGTAQDNLDPSRPETAAYLKILKHYGLAKDLPDPWFCAGFAQILTTVQFMNAVGYNKLSTAAISKQAKQWRGPFLLGQPDIHCGEYAKYPASCSNETIYFRYLGHGKFKAASGWLKPPPSLQPGH